MRTSLFCVIMMLHNNTEGRSSHITLLFRSPVYRNNIIQIYRVSQEEWTKLWESVPYVELYRYNPKHLYPKLNGYGDNGQRSLKL